MNTKLLLGGALALAAGLFLWPKDARAKENGGNGGYGVPPHVEEKPKPGTSGEAKELAEKAAALRAAILESSDLETAAKLRAEYYTVRKQLGDESLDDAVQEHLYNLVSAAVNSAGGWGPGGVETDTGDEDEVFELREYLPHIEIVEGEFEAQIAVLDTFIAEIEEYRAARNLGETQAQVVYSVGMAALAKDPPDFVEAEGAINELYALGHPGKGERLAAEAQRVADAAFYWED